MPVLYFFISVCGLSAFSISEMLSAAGGEGGGSKYSLYYGLIILLLLRFRSKSSAAVRDHRSSMREKIIIIIIVVGFFFKPSQSFDSSKFQFAGRDKSNENFRHSPYKTTAIIILYYCFINAIFLRMKYKLQQFWPPLLPRSLNNR